MNYRILAADLDGTLLDSRGEISLRTSRAICEAVRSGLLFVVSTGRPFQGVVKYRSFLELQAPVITYNGAMIVRPQTGEVLFEQGLERDSAAAILKLGRACGTTMCIWSHNQLYGNVLNERIYDYKKLSDTEPLLADDTLLLEKGITKIVWYDTPERVRRFQEELEGRLPGVAFCTSKPCFLEFFSRRVSKAAALEQIGRWYGVSREEIAAIGDGCNDLDMLKYAGLGVAMGNAPPEVKQTADWVTRSNNEDGVAEVIERILCPEISGLASLKKTEMPMEFQNK